MAREKRVGRETPQATCLLLRLHIIDIVWLHIIVTDIIKVGEKNSAPLTCQIILTSFIIFIGSVRKGIL